MENRSGSILAWSFVLLGCMQHDVHGVIVLDACK